MWPDGYISFPIFGHLQQWKFAQKCHKFAKVGSLFCQIRKKPFKICQRFVKFYQSCEISPNQVTLPTINLILSPQTDSNLKKDLEIRFYRRCIGSLLQLAKYWTNDLAIWSHWNARGTSLIAWPYRILPNHIERQAFTYEQYKVTVHLTILISHWQGDQ